MTVPADAIDWAAVDKRTGFGAIVRARLYFEARAAAVRELSVKQHKAVAPEHVELAAVAEGEAHSEAVARLRAKVAAVRGQGAVLQGASKVGGAPANGATSGGKASS